MTKAVVFIQYLEDEADASAVLDAMMDGAMNACPQEQDRDADCWCSVGVGHIEKLTDNQAIDWAVVEMDDEDD